MRHDTIILVIAAACSAGLHVIVLPLVSFTPSLIHSPTTKATHLETPELDDFDIELGIDASKESTLTWIGYEEYVEQRARFAKVEQAEMHVSTEISRGIITLEELQRITSPIAEFAKQTIEAFQKLDITFPSGETEPFEEKIVEVAPVEPSTSEPEQPSAQPSPSDRYSQATSVIHVSPDQWKAGKPLAGEGVVLRPRRPSFTANQTVSSLAGNLAAELIIDKSGKPVDVVILINTGSYSIDKTIEASLYRWRASGEKIDALHQSETVRITINILFN
jgi:hypothetical protein